MMGTQAEPERLFYDFCLDEHVPQDYVLRQIDRFLDLSEVRRESNVPICVEVSRQRSQWRWRLGDKMNAIAVAAEDA